MFIPKWHKNKRLKCLETNPLCPCSLSPQWVLPIFFDTPSQDVDRDVKFLHVDSGNSKFHAVGSPCDRGVSNVSGKWGLKLAWKHDIQTK